MAYFLLLELQLTALLAALLGDTFAFRVIFFPASIVFFPVILMDFTFTLEAFLILILIVAFLPLPSLAFAVMVTVLPAPAALAVTTPLEDTVAYFLLLELQLTALLEALEGDTTAFRVVLLPAVRLVIPVILTEVTFLFLFAVLFVLLPFVLLPFVLLLPV